MVRPVFANLHLEHLLPLLTAAFYTEFATLGPVAEEANDRGTACGAISTSVETSQQSDKPLIGVVSKGQAHKFWQSIHAGVVAAGEEFDVEILWNGPAQDTDYSRQIQIVDSMVARGVDGLAIAPVERTALVLPIERAVKAGIPVTIYDSGLDSDVYMTYVATNNYQGGEMAGRKLAELIGGKGEVVMVMHMPGSAASMDREKAFADVIEKEFPEIKIVGKQYGMGDRAKVLAAAENLLTANPNVDGIFASAGASAVGASRALKARGVAGKVKFVAFDACDELIEDLKGATIDALVAQDPFRIGYESSEVDSSKTERWDTAQRD